MNLNSNMNILYSYIPDLIFWIITVIWRNNNNKDLIFMRKRYIKDFNGWQISHFLSYFIKGLFFKKKYIFEFFIIGFIFEIFEFFIENFTSLNYVDCSMIKDVIINTSGYIFGIIISKLI